MLERAPIEKLFRLGMPNSGYRAHGPSGSSASGKRVLPLILEPGFRVMAGCKMSLRALPLCGDHLGRPVELEIERSNRRACCVSHRKTRGPTGRPLPPGRA